MLPLNKLQQAILRTVAYASVFDYPLTPRQLHKYLIGERASLSEVQKELHHLRTIGIESGYVVSKKQTKFVELRIKRAVPSAYALEQAGIIVQVLALIPTIRCIAISGSLAMANSSEDSDIDFFIISKKNTVWVTRLITVYILMILGKKRTPGEEKSPYSICTNYWISEHNLTIPDQNVYTAHEVTQMIPIVNKNQMYERFMMKNSWVSKYLPNSVIPHVVKKKNSAKKLWTFFTGMVFLPLDIFVFAIQYLYMRSGITLEKISLHTAKFHPVDRSVEIARAYQRCYREIKRLENEKRKNVVHYTGRFYSGIQAKPITPGS